MKNFLKSAYLVLAILLMAMSFDSESIILLFVSFGNFLLAACVFRTVELTDDVENPFNLKK